MLCRIQGWHKSGKKERVANLNDYNPLKTKELVDKLKN